MHRRQMAVSLHCEPFPFDPRFEDRVNRLKEIVAMSLRVEASQVRAKEAIEKFALPWANTESFRIGPWDMPENCDTDVGTPLLYHPWQKSEMIVLHKQQRILYPGQFLENRV